MENDTTNTHLFHLLLMANCGFPAVRRLESMGGDAGLAALQKHIFFTNKLTQYVRFQKPPD